jgi:hypothetical protein
VRTRRSGLTSCPCLRLQRSCSRQHRSCPVDLRCEHAVHPTLELSNDAEVDDAEVDDAEVDDAEVVAATAKNPVEVGVFGCTRIDNGTCRGHNLKGVDVVTGPVVSVGIVGDASSKGQSRVADRGDLLGVSRCEGSITREKI